MRLFTIAAGLALVGLRLAASTVYLGTDRGQFGTLNSLTGVFTEIKASGTGINGLAFDSLGNLDATDLGSAPNVGFYRVNVSTGALVFVANTTNISGNVAFTSSSVDGTLYLGDHVDLYTVNPTTAAATLLGPDHVPGHNPFNLGFGPDGILYGAYSGTLYKFDLANGNGTPIGPYGPTLFALFPADGILYGISNARNLYRIDTATGASTLLKPIIGPANGNILGAAVAPATASPEPATGILTAAAVALLACRRRAGWGVRPK